MKRLRALFKKSASEPKTLTDVDAYELLSNSLPYGVSLLDPDLNVIRSNVRMQEWFPGLNSGKQQKCYQVFNDPPRTKPCPECRKHRDLKGEKNSEFFRHVRTSKGFRTLRLKSVPLKDTEGAFHGFLEIADDITEQETQEEIRTNYMRFLELINRVSAEVVNIPDEEWNNQIHSTLRQLGEFFAVDRCCLFDFDPEKNLLTNTHEWCAPGISAQIEFLQDVPESALPWWFKQLKTLEPIHFPDIMALPPEAGLEKQELIRQEIKSILYFPMRDEARQCIGCIGFDAVQCPRIWQNDHISMLKVFTTLLTGTVLRKKNRESLLHRESQYRQLVDNSLNGVYSLELICDVDGTPLDLRILSANPAGAEILHQTRHHLAGNLASEMFPDLAKPSVLKQFSKLIRTGEGQTLQITTTGTNQHLNLTAYPLHGLRFGLVIADNTEREQAMRALQTKTEELESYFQSSLDMLCILSKDGILIETNPEWSSITGHKPEDLAGTPILSFIPEADHAGVLAFLSSAANSEHSLDLTVQMKHADGNLRWLELRARAIGDLLYASARDITSRKLAEEEHNTLQQQLNQALKMESIGRLAGGVAHDFNNTLQVILGNSEMALNFQNPSPTLKNTLLEIRDAARRSSTLTRQLLAFARKQNIEPREVHLNETLQGMMKMLRRLIGERIKLEWSLAEDLWPVFIDPGQVDQLLANLCVNAGDAIENEGEILIQTENVSIRSAAALSIPGAKPGDYVKLSVRDNGTGIPPELREKIFEPFLTTKAEGKGTGLGLATVHGIVLQNKGFITLESEPGIGSCFKIHLPRHHSTSEPRKEKAGSQPILKGDETILIVEDEPMILQMTELTLNKLGYKTNTAASPLEALAFAQDSQYDIDLLLTDVVMPDMDGKELSRQLTALRPGLKTLYMSGYTNETMTKYGIICTDISFIQKPFSVAEISHKLRAALDNHNS
ncbi:MAG: PAS domain-containing protein [Verrucomicrobia bacterium]|nr:PAS domain-containing protein [Verrucomicrobiota bacterium]MCH8526622.1 PAS domain-containing protein [Kiritimatiellia bacterium]